MSTPESSEFDPYHKWLGIPLAEQPPNHYRLLGLTEFEDDPDVIAAAADRQMGHVKGFATGRYGAHSQQLLNELAKARVCLLNAKLKPAYDEELRRKLAPQPAAPARTVAPAVATASTVAAPPSVIRGPKIQVVRDPGDSMVGLPSLKPPRRALLARRRRRKQNSALPLFLAIAIAAIAIAGVLVYYANQPVP